MKISTYHPEWQENRIKFILSRYPKEFFKGKSVLELGSYNGYIGSTLQKLGANVTVIEGREENVENIKRDYPNINKTYCYNLDCADWPHGKFDIIIHFGLYYHLEFEHKNNLINCINNCDLMFFETVIHDSIEEKIHFREESGNDQSMSDNGGAPTSNYVEKIFKKCDVSYTKISSSELNAGNHHYDHEDKNSDKPDQFARRFWIVDKK
jgi:hypothetical protein